MELHLSESGSHPGQTALKPNYRFSFRPKPNPALALEWEERMIIQQQASLLYSDGELIIICMGSRCNDFFEPLTSSSNVKMPPFWEHLTLQTPPAQISLVSWHFLVVVIMPLWPMLNVVCHVFHSVKNAALPRIHPCIPGMQEIRLFQV